jgi:hypothetical protein
MELDKQFGLAAVFGTETSPAEDEDHRIRSLQFGELATFRGVVGKLVVREDCPGNNVISHKDSSGFDGLLIRDFENYFEFDRHSKRQAGYADHLTHRQTIGAEDVSKEIGDGVGDVRLIEEVSGRSDEDS